MDFHDVGSIQIPIWNVDGVYWLPITTTISLFDLDSTCRNLAFSEWRDMGNEMTTSPLNVDEYNESKQGVSEKLRTIYKVKKLGLTKRTIWATVQEFIRFCDHFKDSDGWGNFNTEKYDHFKVYTNSLLKGKQEEDFEDYDAEEEQSVEKEEYISYDLGKYFKSDEWQDKIAKHVEQVREERVTSKLEELAQEVKEAYKRKRDLMDQWADLQEERIIEEFKQDPSTREEAVEMVYLNMIAAKKKKSRHI